MSSSPDISNDQALRSRIRYFVESRCAVYESQQPFTGVCQDRITKLFGARGLLVDRWCMNTLVVYILYLAHFPSRKLPDIQDCQNVGSVGDYPCALPFCPDSGMEYFRRPFA